MGISYKTSLEVAKSILQYENRRPYIELFSSTADPLSCGWGIHEEFECARHESSVGFKLTQLEFNPYTPNYECSIDFLADQISTWNLIQWKTLCKHTKLIEIDLK